MESSRSSSSYPWPMPLTGFHGEVTGGGSQEGEQGSWAPPPPALCSKFYILLSLPWFPYPRREPKWSLSFCQPWEEGKQPRGRFSCPKSFQHLLGEREGSCVVFGLQFHFNFFFLLCLSLNIQSITLAQCMSPKILQGFHGLDLGGAAGPGLSMQGGLHL